MLYAFILSAFFLNGIVYAQGNVLELLPGTEKIIYSDITGEHRLIGTVNFTYQGNTMYCDSAHYNEKRKIVHAYGQVLTPLITMQKVDEPHIKIMAE